MVEPDSTHTEIVVCDPDRISRYAPVGTHRCISCFAKECDAVKVLWDLVVVDERNFYADNVMAENTMLYITLNVMYRICSRNHAHRACSSCFQSGVEDVNKFFTNFGISLKEHHLVYVADLFKTMNVYVWDKCPQCRMPH